jgi:hypothetical protein
LVKHTLNIYSQPSLSLSLSLSGGCSYHGTVYFHPLFLSSDLFAHPLSEFQCAFADAHEYTDLFFTYPGSFHLRTYLDTKFNPIECITEFRAIEL